MSSELGLHDAASNSTTGNLLGLIKFPPRPIHPRQRLPQSPHYLVLFGRSGSLVTVVTIRPSSSHVVLYPSNTLRMPARQYAHRHHRHHRHPHLRLRFRPHIRFRRTIALSLPLSAPALPFTSHHHATPHPHPHPHLAENPSIPVLASTLWRD